MPLFGSLSSLGWSRRRWIVTGVLGVSFLCLFVATFVLAVEGVTVYLTIPFTALTCVLFAALVWWICRDLHIFNAVAQWIGVLVGSAAFVVALAAVSPDKTEATHDGSVGGSETGAPTTNARVRAPELAWNSVVVNVEVLRPAQAGRTYWLIARYLDPSTGGTRFAARARVSSEPGKYALDLDISEAREDSVRFFFVVEADAPSDKVLQDNYDRKEGSIRTSLPDGAVRVSNDSGVAKSRQK